MRGKGLVTAAIAAGAEKAEVRFRTVNGWKFLVLMCWNPYRSVGVIQRDPGLFDVVAVYPDIQTGMANVASDVRTWKEKIEAKEAARWSDE